MGQVISVEHYYEMLSKSLATDEWAYLSGINIAKSKGVKRSRWDDESMRWALRVLLWKLYIPIYRLRLKKKNKNKNDTFLVHVFKFILQEQGLDFSPH